MPEETDIAVKGIYDKSDDYDLGENGSPGKNYFIGIGIDKYQLPGLNLSTCVNDCNKLSKILTDQYGFTVFGNLLNEEATQKNIQGLFENFRNSKPDKLDSLILFFSGHGDLFPIDADEKGIITDGIGCWVTHEAGGRRLNDLYKISSVIDEIRQMNLLHILVISDCCHAGTMLEQPSFYNFKAAAGGGSLEMARSRWAVCSSRSNETSIAGSVNTLSRFTERLIYELNNNTKENFLLKSLTSNIEEYFNEKNWQSPLAGALNIIKNNGGQFIFKIKQDERILKERKKVLDINLESLDFSEPKKILRRIGESQKDSEKKKLEQVAILSGTPDCGLKYLSNKVKKTGIFKDGDVKAKYIYPQFSIIQDGGVNTQDEQETTQDDQVILQLFNQVFEPPFENTHTLKNYFLSLEHHEIIELGFYKEGAYPAEYKIQLIKKLISLIGEINSESKNVNRILLIILDEEECDYNALFVTGAIPGIEPFVFPKFNALSFDDIANWYGDVKTAYMGKGDDADKKEKQFDLLFEKCLYKNINDIVATSAGKPGKVIIEICDKAACPDIGTKMLNP